MNIVEPSVEKDYISKPYIGINVQDVSTETQQYGIRAGAAVQSIAENCMDGKAMTSKPTPATSLGAGHR